MKILKPKTDSRKSKLKKHCDIYISSTNNDLQGAINVNLLLTFIKSSQKYSLV